MAIVVAGLTRNEHEAKLLSGLQGTSIVRAQFLCAEVIAEKGDILIKHSLTCNVPIRILKRSKDGTPVRTRVQAGTIMKSSVLNARLHCSCGSAGDLSSSRIGVLGGELFASDALGVQECLARMCPSLAVDNIVRSAKGTEWFVYFDLGDNCSVNELDFKMMCAHFHRQRLDGPSAARFTLAT